MDYIWVTSQGKWIPVSEMTDKHLEHAIGFIERGHSIGLKNLRTLERLEWIDVFKTELDKRNEPQYSVC